MEFEFDVIWMRCGQSMAKHPSKHSNQIKPWFHLNWWNSNLNSFWTLYWQPTLRHCTLHPSTGRIMFGFKKLLKGSKRDKEGASANNRSNLRIFLIDCVWATKTTTRLGHILVIVEHFCSKFHCALKAINSYICGERQDIIPTQDIWSHPRFIPELNGVSKFVEYLQELFLVRFRAKKGQLQTFSGLSPES